MVSNVDPIVRIQGAPLNIEKYTLKDLLEETTASAALEYLIRHRPSRDQVVPFFVELLGSKNENVIDLLIESSLIDQESIENCLPHYSWLIEHCAHALIRAIDQKKEKVFRFLIDGKIFNGIISQFAHLLTKPILEKILKEKHSSQFFNRFKLIIQQDSLHSILLEILEEALLNDYNFIVYYFKDSVVLEKSIGNSIQQSNAKILIKLIKYRLIDADAIKRALSKNRNLKEKLTNEFKIACKEPEHNEVLITVLIDSDIQLDEQDIYEIAKSGNFSRLKKLVDKGFDISNAVFKLINYKKGAIIEKLLKEDYGKSGLDSNLRNQAGNTLLIEAVKADQPSLVETLLAYGANPLIRDHQDRSVFDLSKDKCLHIRQLLYNPKQVHPQRSLGSRGYNSQKAKEEKVLRQFLKRKAQGKPINKFYGLFIKVNEVAISILKAEPFFNKLPESESESTYHHPRNRIHCWVATSLYSIPEEFAVNHTSMNTLGFAIIRGSNATLGGEIVEVDKQRYTCIRLENSYKANNPEIDYGFKYSYGGVQTHGHGKNPEAVRAAFKEHKDGVKLRHWITIPDLSADQESHVRFSKQMAELFEVESKNAEGLVKLVEIINSFMEKAGSIIEARYSTFSTNERMNWEENNLIESFYKPVQEGLRKIHAYTFNDQRLAEWKVAIQQQMLALQELQKKLQEAQPMLSSAFEAEKASVEKHLAGIKDLVINRTVTSAEVPTLKIYTSSLIIEDIFEASSVTIQAMKKAICQLIGSMLVKIPVTVDTTLADHFLEGSFRKDVLCQLTTEAQFIAGHTIINDYRVMQELASHLALLQDTATILEAMPPISLTSNRTDLADEVLEGTILSHLNSYAAARKSLDHLWLEICYDKVILEKELDFILELLTRRLLLMDEEIRQEEKGCFLYPLMDLRCSKRILDEQLFLLQTSLLIALRNQPEELRSPFIQSTMALVQIRLTPALYGTEKRKYKFDGLFLPYLLDTVPKIKELVKAAWESDPAVDSPFKPLNDLLQKYHSPEKKELEHSLIESFKQLVQDKARLNFDPSVKEFISILRKMREEIEKLIRSFKSEDNTPLILQELKDLLKQAKIVFDCLKIEKTASCITPSELLKILAHSTLSESDKVLLKEGIIIGFTSDIRASIEELIRLMKNLPQLDLIEVDKAKTLQREIGRCSKSIREYLASQEKASDLDFFSFREQLNKILGQIKNRSKGTLEKSVNKMDVVSKKLSDPESNNIELVFEIKALIDQLNSFFKKKGEKIADSYKESVQALTDQNEPYLNRILPVILEKLITPLKACQKALSSKYVEKIEKEKAQLCLGIREQTYYTTNNDNISYYLWAGKKFDALPYHTDNEVHIPLVEDSDWAGVQTAGWMRSHLQEETQDKKLHATRLRNNLLNSRRVTRRFEPLELSKKSSPNSDLSRQSSRDDLVLERLHTTYLNLVEKKEKGIIDLEEILNFQDQLDCTLSLYKNPKYQRIAKLTEAFIDSICASSTDSPSCSLSSQITFHYEGENYIVKLTKGEGSCALHALLGEEIAGMYQFPGDKSTSSARAKSHFTEKLVSHLKEKSSVQDIFSEVIQDYLNASDESAKMLFHNSTEGEALRQQWVDLGKKHKKSILELNSQEAKVWLPLVQAENSTIFEQMMVYIGQIEDNTSPYFKKSRDEVLEMMRRNPCLILDKVRENSTTFLKLLQEKQSKKEILNLIEKRNDLIEGQNKEKAQFILSEKLIEHYVTTLKDPSFYLNTNEIKLAAELFNKNVLIMVSAEKDIMPSEYISKSPFDGKEPIVIHHKGVHFSRCDKVS